MADDGTMPDDYMTQEGRLASFKAIRPVPRRGSTAKGRKPKALAWPHKQLDPETLARAGFYFDPEPGNPDNTACFLCQKKITGWKETDNPFEEHLRLSPTCGWAIVAAVEVDVGGHRTVDPSHVAMLEARKETFMDSWPHEGRRAFKCKVKQMADAGWHYTPTSDSDDMATCAYCSLALDGWEPNDQPMDEHYKRSNDCLFFRLINQNQPGAEAAGKTTGRTGARTSKVSRISSQSVVTPTPDVSLMDQTAEADDTVLTTASTVTAGGTKRARAKKGTAAKGKTTRGRRDAPVEVHEDAADEDFPAPKPTRGRKRKSDAVDDSVLSNSQGPAQKKRATRSRRNSLESSVLEPHPDVSMLDNVPVARAKTARKKGRVASKTRKASAASRKASARTAASASKAIVEDQTMDDQTMDDEELDRQLQMDFDRPLSDDEMIAADSDSERQPLKAKGKMALSKEALMTKAVISKPSPATVKDADMSANSRALRSDVAIEQDPMLIIPKKGRQAGTRKASNPTQKNKQQSVVESVPVCEPKARAKSKSALPAPDVESSEDELSGMSSATVVKHPFGVTSTAPALMHGRPRKPGSHPQPETEDGVPDADKASQVQRAHRPEIAQDQDIHGEAATPWMARRKARMPSPTQQIELDHPSAPLQAVSPLPATSVARHSAVSPSSSPQSSDAENQRPTCKPARNAPCPGLGPVPGAETPTRLSPSKRSGKMVQGLRSAEPWTAVDIDDIFEEFYADNAFRAGDGNGLDRGTELSSAEKQMSVEEWIRHNAALAEDRLRAECEVMVNRFEHEGSRAMRVVQGLVVE